MARDRSSMFDPEAPETPPAGPYFDDVRVRRDTGELHKRQGAGWAPLPITGGGGAIPVTLVPQKPAAGVVVDDMQTGWSGTNVIPDTAVPFRGGLPSARFDSTTSLQSFTKTYGTPLDFSGAFMLLRLRTNNLRATALTKYQSCTIRVSSDNFATTDAFCDSLLAAGETPINHVNKWLPFILPQPASAHDPGVSGVGVWRIAAGKSAPNWAAITQVKVDWRGKVSGTGDATPFSFWIGAIEKLPRPAEPIITFQFDKATVNVLTRGVKALSKHGFVATVFLQQDFIGNTGNFTDPSGYVYPDKATLGRILDEIGWEIGNYGDSRVDGSSNYGAGGTATVPPVPFTAVSTTGVVYTREQVEADLVACRQFIAENCPQRGIDLAAGQNRKLFDEGFDILRRNAAYACMPISSEYACTWPPVNPMKVPTLMYTQSSFGTAGRLEKSVDRAVANNEWLTIKFHDILNTGEPNQGSSLNINETRLQEIVDYVASKGVKVRLTSDVLLGRV